VHPRILPRSALGGLCKIAQQGVANFNRHKQAKSSNLALDSL